MGGAEEWKEVTEFIVNVVKLANQQRPGFCEIAQTSPFISLRRRDNHTAVFEFDEHRRMISITFPIMGEGTPRNGKFKVTPDGLIRKEQFVGKPEPSSNPLLPHEFAKLILEPFLDAV